jgi:hypothetical protein
MIFKKLMLSGLFLLSFAFSYTAPSLNQQPAINHNQAVQELIAPVANPAPVQNRFWHDPTVKTFAILYSSLATLLVSSQIQKVPFLPKPVKTIISTACAIYSFGILGCTLAVCVNSL